MLNVSQARLNKLGRASPSMWTENDIDFIKKSIQRDLSFDIPTYSVQRLQPVDMAAHLQLLGESLNQIAGALEQQVGSLSFLFQCEICNIEMLTQFLLKLTFLP